MKLVGKNSSRAWLGWALAMMVGATAGCGMFSKDDDSSSGDDGDGITNAKNRGCIQGVVTDGITGERVALTGVEAEQTGVFVLVRNRLLQAKLMLPDPAVEGANQRLQGEYYLCGFPLDEEFPLFVWVNGYQNFESTIKVRSTIAQLTPESHQEDILRRFPTKLANITIYPEGAEQDLKIRVVNNSDEPVAGAQVYVRPTGNHTFNDGADRTELLPQIRLAPQHATTDADGSVTIAGAHLVMGGIYSYRILPPNEANMLFAEGEFHFGFHRSGHELMDRPFEIEVPLIERETDDEGDDTPEG